MRVPTLDGVIERRLLVNYRVDPSAIVDVLPPPFRPTLVGGYAIAGICLIRLASVRPHGLPAGLGLRSENAAHRIAVEWDADGRTHEGVYIPRRDSDSRLNALVGGRVFPGQHHKAVFTVSESDDRFSVALRSDDERTHVAVVGRIARALPPGSVFANLEEASAFFRRGSVGYSATDRHGRFDGLELRIAEWRADPLSVEHVESSFFDDTSRFPAGTTTFDCALVMRAVHHSWHALPTLSCSALDTSAA
jgi:uncharacterized protein YqjF (DUF2071 family)